MNTFTVSDKYIVCLAFSAYRDTDWNALSFEKQKAYNRNEIRQEKKIKDDKKNGKQFNTEIQNTNRNQRQPPHAKTTN